MSSEYEAELRQKYDKKIALCDPQIYRWNILVELEQAVNFLDHVINKFHARGRKEDADQNFSMRLTA